MSPERHQRIVDMLNNRHADLAVCMEDVHKPHNLAAVIRSCDAAGAHNVHAIWSDEAPKRMTRGTTAGSGSQNWVKVINHETSADAIAAMKAAGMQILVTHLSDSAVDYREIDYCQPTAIILGREKYGVSELALEQSDQHIIIPMVGMVQSLNVSVANALVLYEATHQRKVRGYDIPRLPEQEKQRLLFEGGHPILAKECRKKGLPYPFVDAEGEVDADDEWWQKMQLQRDNWPSEAEK